MKKESLKTSKSIKRMKTGVAVTVAFSAVLVTSVLFYQVQWLWKNHAWQQNQIMFVNSRLNNARECLKLGDQACPENKYVDSQPYLEDEAAR